MQSFADLFRLLEIAASQSEVHVFSVFAESDRLGPQFCKAIPKTLWRRRGAQSDRKKDRQTKLNRLSEFRIPIVDEFCHSQFLLDAKRAIIEVTAKGESSR